MYVNWYCRTVNPRARTQMIQTHKSSARGERTQTHTKVPYMPMQNWKHALKITGKLVMFPLDNIHFKKQKHSMCKTVREVKSI